MTERGYKGYLFVPLEVIPEQMSIEQFCEAIKNNDPVVMEIVNKKCCRIENS